LLSVGEGLPWGESGIDPTFDYCPCCGVEFGYQDATLESVRMWRQRWADTAYSWAQPDKKPTGWSAAEQALNIPSRAR